MQPILRSDDSYVTYSFAYGCAANSTVALCLVAPPVRLLSLGLPHGPGCCQWWLSGWARPQRRVHVHKKTRDERLQRSPRRRSSRQPRCSSRQV